MRAKHAWRSPSPSRNFAREHTQIQASAGDGRARLFEIVAQILAGDEQGWRGRLGALMYENTVADVM